MKKFKIIFIALSVYASYSATAQLTTSNALTPTQIVQDVLLGPGISASNIQFFGDPDQLGTFVGFNSNIGLDSGLVMCSGSVSVANGPNTIGSLTQGGGNFGVSDPDLNTIVAPLTTNDRAVLEFDFVPTGDSVKFNFVFGSEEYNEYVCGTVNDVFAFFLSGPGINGPYSNNAENIALIPGTTVPVQINTVNNGTVGTFGTLQNCIDADPNWTNNSGFFIDNTGGTTVEFDGFTVVITAAAQVICGQTYHIKIALADVGDTAFDSGVFIEAGSFSSNLISFDPVIDFGGNDSTLYEGCGQATLHLTRVGDISMPDTVLIQTSGQAINGTDYTAIPDSLFFQANQDSVSIVINAFDDGITEGLESVGIMAIVETSCFTDTSFIELYINEPPDINITMSNDTTLTCGDSTLVIATITGGYPPYTIDWNGGIPDGNAQGWVSPLQTTTYEVTVTDTCGVITATGEVTINIPITDPIVTNISADTTVFCPESPVELTSAGDGGTGPYSYAWSGPLGTDSIANVAPPITTTYSLTVTDACGMDTTDMVTVNVLYDTLQVAISNDTTICVGDVIQIGAFPTLGYNGYTYVWNNGPTDQFQNVSPANGTAYSVIVTDGCGISASNNMFVGTSQPIADFSWSGSVHVENLPVQFLDNSFNAQDWYWDFGNGSIFSDAQNPVITYPEDGLYTVMLAVWDGLGCSDTAYSEILIQPEFQFYAPSAFSPDGDGHNDYFFGNGVGIKDYQLMIFDRWGQLIFETEELFGEWDGRINGSRNIAPEGVYVYKFRLRSLTGQVEEKFGHITLIK